MKRLSGLFLCFAFFSLNILSWAFPVHATGAINGSAVVAAVLRGFGVGVSTGADLEKFEQECQSVWNALPDDVKSQIVKDGGKVSIPFSVAKVVWNKFALGHNDDFRSGGGSFGGAGAVRDIPSVGGTSETSDNERIYQFINGLKPGMILMREGVTGYSASELSDLWGVPVSYYTKNNTYQRIQWVNNFRVEAVYTPLEMYEYVLSVQLANGWDLSGEVPIFDLGNCHIKGYAPNFNGASNAMVSWSMYHRDSDIFGDALSEHNFVVVSYVYFNRVYVSMLKVSGGSLSVCGMVNYAADDAPGYTGKLSSGQYWADGVSVLNNKVDTVITRIQNVTGGDTITIDESSSVTQIAQTTQNEIYHNTTIATESDYVNNQQTNVNKEGDNYYANVGGGAGGSSSSIPDSSSSSPDTSSIPESSSSPDSSSKPDEDGGFSWEWLWNFIKGLGKFLGELISSLLEAIGSVLAGLKGLFSLIKGFLDFLGGAFTYLPPEIWALISAGVVIGIILRIFKR